MKQLKKDDGYVLIYVLVVFTILSFVAVTICSTALKNLQAQKAAAVRMEARYEAEGYLQQFIAEICSLNITADGEGDTPDEAKWAAEAGLTTQFLDGVRGTAVTFIKEAEEGDEDIVYLTLSGESTADQLEITANDLEGTVRITAKIKVSLEETYSDQTETTTTQNGVEETTYYCKAALDKVNLQYTFYDISYITADGAGEEVPDDEA